MDKKIIIGIGLLIIIGIFGFILLRPEPTPVPADFDNQADCEAANFYWWNDTCNLEPEPIEPEITLEVEEIFAEGEKITATVDITNPANRYFSGKIPVYFAGERIYNIQVANLPPGETIERQVIIVKEAQLGEFTLEIAGKTKEITVIKLPIEPKITLEMGKIFAEGEKITAMVFITNPADRYFSGEIPVYFTGERVYYIQVVNLPPEETIGRQVIIVEEAQLGEFTLEIAGETKEITVIKPPIEPEVTIKPQVILRGDIILTSYLPLNIKQAHIATFDIFYEGELVGKSTWERIREDKTKVMQSISIPEVKVFYRLELIATIIHCPNSLKPKEIKQEGTLDDVPFYANIIIDYETNRITIMGEQEGFNFEFSHKMLPNTTNKIDIQNLDVNWKFDFLIPKEYLEYFEDIPFPALEVFEKTTVTVPAGTFDVLAIKYTGSFMFMEKEFMFMKKEIISYITLDGKAIKSSSFIYDIPGLDSPIISKLRSYERS